MSTQIRPVHRDMPMLLPPDLRDWVPEDDIVHFVIEAVEQMPSTPNSFAVNHRGTGSKQYSPRMMLALLVYCYDTLPATPIPTTTRFASFDAGTRRRLLRLFCMS
jgi:hypothetical protein